MKRRRILKSLTAAAGTLLVLPAWAHQWNHTSVHSGSTFLSSANEAVLNEMVSTLIPEGKIPGAQSLGVPAFIQKMLADCYEKEAQADFQKGLAMVDALAKQSQGKPFPELSAAQKKALLESLEATADAKQKEFYTLVKNLTIQGYTTSEYVMVNHLHYNMAPGHFHGCVPV